MGRTENEGWMFGYLKGNMRKCLWFIGKWVYIYYSRSLRHIPKLPIKNKRRDKSLIWLIFCIIPYNRHLEKQRRGKLSKLTSYYQSPLYTLLKRRILPQFLVPVHYSPFLPWIQLHPWDTKIPPVGIIVVDCHPFNVILRDTMPAERTDKIFQGSIV